MNTFSLILVGILIGSLFFLTLAAVAVMAYTSWRQREDMHQSTSKLALMMNRSNAIASQLRSDVTSALAAMDANRLHDASIAIQLGARKLDHAVTTLNKVIFAAGMGDAGMGLTGQDLDELGDTAQQQVQYVDDPRQMSHRATVFPPPGTFPTSTSPSDDPFVRWRTRQQDAAASQSGASFPTAPPGPLPDMEAAFAEDIHDGEVMSDADVAALPGMTLEE